MAFTKPKTAKEIRAQRPDTPQRAARRAALLETMEAEVALHEIRERRGISQAMLAERLEVSRPRVSTIERAGEDLRVSTLERYVAALGGTLRIVATFDDEEIDVVRHGTRAD